MNTKNASRDKIINDIIDTAKGLEKSQWVKNEESQYITTCGYRLSMINKNTGQIIDVYQFNDNGFIYQIGSKWAMAENGGKSFIHGWPDQKKGRECFKLDGTGEIMRVDEIYQCDSTKPSTWSIIDEQNKDTCDYKVTAKDSTTGSVVNDVYPFNTINGKVYNANGAWVMGSCGGTYVYQTTLMPADECWILGGTDERIKIENKCDIANHSLWEIIRTHNEGTCESMIDVRNKKTGQEINYVRPFNTIDGDVYKVEGNYVMASCGGEYVTPIEIDNQSGYKLVNNTTNRHEVILGCEKKPDPTPTPNPTSAPKFECVSDGRNYGLDIMATYCSFSNADSGHFWLRDSGFIDISSSEKTSYAFGLENKYQYCGVLSINEVQNYGGDTYCSQAHIYWGKPTLQSRNLRKVQTIEPLNPNILETMSDYNKTEYSKKLNKQK